LKESVFKSIEELPLFLNAEVVGKALGVSISSAYELMHEKGFPSVRIGNRLIVPKDKFVECYFHPSRDKEYPTAVIKRLAKCAMQLLWDTEHLNLSGVNYGNQDIRKIMIEETMPEDIDMAVSFLGDYKKLFHH